MSHASDLPISIQEDSYCSWGFPSFQSGHQQRQPHFNLGNPLIWSLRGSQTTRRNESDILLSHPKALGNAPVLQPERRCRSELVEIFHATSSDAAEPAGDLLRSWVRNPSHEQQRKPSWPKGSLGIISVRDEPPVSKHPSFWKPIV